jgi:hypothetical protein
MPFYAIILRPFVEQKIAEHGWRNIVQWAAMGLFDGEILALGAMNPQDIEDSADLLDRVGFKGPKFGDDADYAMFSSGVGTMPAWLECVEVRLLDDPKIKFDAWKMKNSEVYELHDFHDRKKYPTKGYEVDWPPYIGKIS